MAYLSLSTANLPNPGIDPAQGKLPAKYFDTFLYTGNGGGLQVGDVIKKPADTTDITNSLIINDDDSAYLSRTHTSGGDRTTWTWSGWVKRGTVGTNAKLFQSFGPGGFGIEGSIAFDTSNRIDFLFDYNGGTRHRLITDQVFKDVSSWYHIQVVADTSNGTTTDRLRLYVNGLRVTDFSSSNYPSTSSYQGTLNQAYAHGIGATTTPSSYFDGYMA